jgi:hypothetical protein
MLRHVHFVFRLHMNRSRGDDVVCAQAGLGLGVPQSQQVAQRHFETGGIGASAHAWNSSGGSSSDRVRRIGGEGSRGEHRWGGLGVPPCI